MKLGLRIININQGSQEALLINKNDSWVKYAFEPPIDIKKIAGFERSGKCIYFLKFIEEGYLISVIKSTPPEGGGRDGDFTVAWIFVPVACSISSTETIKAINVVETAINNKSRIDVESLEEFFSYDGYDRKDLLVSAVGVIRSKAEGECAYRYYNGDYTLNELLGANIAQREYGNYKGVFIIDEKYGFHVSGKILDFEPRQIITLKPLGPVDGFIPCLPTQSKQLVPFNKPIEVALGTKLEIYWKKDKYANIRKDVIVKDENSLSEMVITPNEYKRVIRRSSISVVSDSYTQVEDYEIRINGILIVGDSIEVSDAALEEGLTVTVSAEGYETEQKENVRAFPVKIVLPMRIYHYEFEIPVNDSRAKGTLTIKTHHRIKSSPLNGYYMVSEPSEGEGKASRNYLHLENDLKTKLKYFALGVAACLLVGALYLGCSLLSRIEISKEKPYIWFEKTESPSGKQSDIGMQRTNSTNNVYNQVELDSIVKQAVKKEREMLDELYSAVVYMERNEKWHKDELEKFQCTKDLFDYLNTYDLENIIKSNKQFDGRAIKLSEIIEAIGTGKDKGVNLSGKYNGDSDNEITINKYIKHVSGKQKTSPGTTSAPSADSQGPDNSYNGRTGQ